MFICVPGSKNTVHDLSVYKMRNCKSVSHSVQEYNFNQQFKENTNEKERWYGDWEKESTSLKWFRRMGRVLSGPWCIVFFKVWRRKGGRQRSPILVRTGSPRPLFRVCLRLLPKAKSESLSDKETKVRTQNLSKIFKFLNLGTNCSEIDWLVQAWKSKHTRNTWFDSEVYRLKFGNLETPLLTHSWLPLHSSWIGTPIPLCPSEDPHPARDTQLPSVDKNSGRTYYYVTVAKADRTRFVLGATKIIGEGSQAAWILSIDGGKHFEGHG
jgi:hypothetical protein